MAPDNPICLLPRVNLEVCKWDITGRRPESFIENRHLPILDEKLISVPSASRVILSPVDPSAELRVDAEQSRSVEGERVVREFLAA